MILRTRSNNIEEVGATELHEAMHSNNTLRQLHLSYNKIKETGAAAVRDKNARAQHTAHSCSSA